MRARLAASLVTLAGCAGEPTADVVVTPDWDGARRPVDPAARAHNTVWSRDGLGIWDPAAGAPAADVWPGVAALAPGALRFPGGTRGLRWRFAETIGPVAGRVPQCDTFTGALDATTYGLGEMLRVADAAGAPALLMTPLADGTPEEAAAMLAYASAAASSDAAIGVDRAGVDWATAGAWAARRDADGVPRADVLLVEIGNEPYLDLPVGPSSSCGRAGRFRQDERWEGDVAIPITAADYAAQVAAHAAALRAVDPDVRIGASAMTAIDGTDADVTTLIGPNDRDDAWNPRLVADAGDAFDAWVLHPYDFSSSDDRARLADRTRDAARAVAALDPTKRIAVTELGTLFDADTMLGALLAADFVRVGVEEQWLVVARHILIEDDPTGPFAASAAILGPDHARTPAWHVHAALAAALGPEAVAVAQGADDVVVLATIGPGDARGLVVIDRRPRPDAPDLAVEIDLGGRFAGEATTIDAPALTSRDVTVATAPVAPAEVLRVASSPSSVTVVRLGAASGATARSPRPSSSR